MWQTGYLGHVRTVGNRGVLKMSLTLSLCLVCSFRLVRICLLFVFFLQKKATDTIFAHCVIFAALISVAIALITFCSHRLLCSSRSLLHRLSSSPPLSSVNSLFHKQDGSMCKTLKIYN